MGSPRRTELRLLGRFAVLRDGVEIPLSAYGSRKARTLLRVLAARRGEPVRIDALVEALWPGRAPRDPGASLAVLASRARRALGVPEAIRSGEGSYILADGDWCTVDTEHFLAAVDAAEGLTGEQAVEVIRRALDTWRGDPLAEDADADWARPYRDRLERARQRALERAAGLADELGDHRLAVELATAATDLEPLREVAALTLVRAYEAAGDRASALLRYDEYRRRLADELGVEPSDEACELFQLLLAGRSAPVVREEPRSGGVDRAPRTNLPTPPTTLIGRTDQSAEVHRLLGTERVVTLTGPGGVGKTRLAVSAATLALDDFADGVWLVELAGVTDSADVAAAAAGVVRARIRPGQRPFDALVEELSTRRLLLVIDNCEHVIDAAALLVDNVMQHCPGVVQLVTSREPLRVGAEWVHRVPPLTVPGPAEEDVDRIIGSEAVQLFWDRAESHRPGFVVDAGTATGVSAVVQRLDGVPLAIELAAGWLRSLPLEELQLRLHRNFDLLVGGSRAAPPRQQTIRAMVDWSYDLLSEPARTVLTRASTFSGGFDLEAAEAVCVGGAVSAPDLVHLLAELVDKSVLQLVDTDDGPRYRLLETIRAYAAGKVPRAAEGNALAVAHRDHYVGFAERAALALQGHGQMTWLRRLDAEQDNLRVALTHALGTAAAEPALRLVNALTRYWYLRGRTAELSAAIRAALSMPGGAAPRHARGRVLAWAAFLGYMFADGSDLRLARSEEALDIANACGDASLAAFALSAKSMVLESQGNYQEALTTVGHAAELARRCGDSHVLARILGQSGNAKTQLGDDGLPDLQESIRINEGLGDHIAANTARGTAGQLKLDQGDLVGARHDLTSALDSAQRLGHLTRIIAMSTSLGLLEHLEGHFVEAADLLAAALEQARQARADSLLVDALQAMALVATEAKNFRHAARVHGAIDDLLDRLGQRLSPVQERLRAEDLARLTEELGSEGLAAARAEGSSMPSDAVVEEAIQQAHALGLGRPSRQLRQLQEGRARAVGRQLAAPDGRVTILFSDIENSTATNEHLGDQRWIRLLATHDSLVRRLVDRHHGDVVKAQGDGFMIVFADAPAAARAAVDIQRAFDQRLAPLLRRTPITLRIGLHIGTAVARDGDYFGRNVTMAARITAEARGREILVSDDFRAAVSEGDEFTFEPRGDVELKGLANRHRLWALGWLSDGVTSTPRGRPEPSWKSPRVLS